MTRDEIDELIRELEKNYHVKCLYTEPDDYNEGKLIVLPTLPRAFVLTSKQDKDYIINKLEDLIRF